MLKASKHVVLAWPGRLLRFCAVIRALKNLVVRCLAIVLDILVVQAASSRCIVCFMLAGEHRHVSHEVFLFVAVRSVTLLLCKDPITACRERSHAQRLLSIVVVIVHHHERNNAHLPRASSVYRLPQQIQIRSVFSNRGI